MSDTTSTPSDATTPSSEGSDKGRAGRCGGCRGGRGRSRFGRKIALLALVFAGVAGLKVAFAGGPHCGHHGGPPTAESVREHLNFVTDRALDHVDATDEQYSSVDAILDQAAPEIAGYASQGQELHGRFASALAADPTNRQALEALRVEGLALADKASTAALDDLVKLASVLSPEQRQKLAQTWEEHKK